MIMNKIVPTEICLYTGTKQQCNVNQLILYYIISDIPQYKREGSACQNIYVLARSGGLI